jgi:hypothetical protein
MLRWAQYYPKKQLIWPWNTRVKGEVVHYFLYLIHPLCVCVWYWGLNSGSTPEPLHQPFFMMGFSGFWVSQTIWPSWLRTVILLSSHHLLAPISFSRETTLFVSGEVYQQKKWWVKMWMKWACYLFHDHRESKLGSVHTCNSSTWEAKVGRSQVWG